ncbi:MAG: hypothetical protein MUF75_03495 [Bacteroidia bacterium]|nr:hypothetical protein [Bacteroidia bacterium]
MKTCPFYIVFGFFVCLSPAFFAQSNYKLNKAGALAMREKNYEEAVHHFRKLYNRDSTNSNVTYAFAEACRLNMETEQALHLYQKVLNKNTKKYPLGVYWTAQLYKQLMQYKEAGKWFTKFSKMKLKKDLPDYKKKAKQEIEVCELAAIWMKNPLPIQIERLDTSINTRFSEYAAFSTNDAFYFSSLRSSKRPQENEVPLSKIYVLEKNNKRKPKPYALDTTVNASYLHNANACIDESGKRLVFSRCKNTNASEYACTLYQSDFVNNKWQSAIKLGDSINVKGYSSTHPSFAVLNKQPVLFFSSNRPGGAGGMDIWYAEYTADGTFSNPKNAGKNVNTNENEITPTLNDLENTLYFSSTAHKNFGAFDVFKSVFKNGEFAEVNNAGYPINSGYNDVYFTLNKENSRAWFSSNRKGANAENKTSCCNDIFTYEIEKEKELLKIDSVLIQKEKLKLLVPLTLYFHNDEPEPRTELIVTEKSYPETYLAYQELFPLYQRSFSAGYKNEEKIKAQEKMESFFRDSLEAGFDNLEKFSELLMPVLKSGQRVRITLKGYCSPLASTGYNQKLAKRRISSLRNYFDRTRNGYFKQYTVAEIGKLPQLEFVEEDIGELPNSKASDDFKDKRNSVYSPFAASERKIQIIAVSFGD